MRLRQGLRKWAIREKMEIRNLITIWLHNYANFKKSQFQKADDSQVEKHLSDVSSQIHTQIISSTRISRVIIA